MNGIVAMIHSIQNTTNVKAVIGNRDLLTDIFPVLLKKTPDVAIDILYCLLGEWQNNHKSYAKITIKTAENYASALVCYIAFLIDQWNTGQLPVLLKSVKGSVPGVNLYKALKKTISVEIYTNKTIKDIFRQRLRTQDRFSVGNLFYPIQLIKNIFEAQLGNKQWFDTWLDGIVSGIKFRLNAKTIILADVEYLKIVGQKVYVKPIGSKKESLVYTETVDSPVKPIRPNPDWLKAAGISQVSLDHDTALSTILSSGTWQGLSDLKKLIDTWRKANPQMIASLPQKYKAAALAKLVANKLLQSSLRLPNIMNRLKADLTKIARCGITVMELSENITKG